MLADKLLIIFCRLLQSGQCIPAPAIAQGNTGIAQKSFAFGPHQRGPEKVHSELGRVETEQFPEIRRREIRVVLQEEVGLRF